MVVWGDDGHMKHDIFQYHPKIHDMCLYLYDHLSGDKEVGEWLGALVVGSRGGSHGLSWWALVGALMGSGGLW